MILVKIVIIAPVLQKGHAKLRFYRTNIWYETIYYDKTDAAHADMCFLNIKITHSEY